MTLLDWILTGVIVILIIVLIPILIALRNIGQLLNVSIGTIIEKIWG